VSQPLSESVKDFGEAWAERDVERLRSMLAPGYIQRLANEKIAIITGGNRGMGFETCRQLGRSGFKVILCCRDPQARVEAFRLDLKPRSRLGANSEGRRSDPRLHALGAPCRNIWLLTLGRHSHQPAKSLRCIQPVQ
jgi:short chain dehydrogenase